MNLQRTKRLRNSGSAVLVLLILLSLLLLIVAANGRTLHYLGRQIRLIEEKQQGRLVQEIQGRTDSDRGGTNGVTKIVPQVELGK